MVTGAGGFLGRYVVREFSSRGWRVTGIDRAGMTQAEARRLGLAGLRVVSLPATDLVELIEVLEPEVIVHAAGPASVPASMAGPAGDFQGATLPLLNVLDAVRVAGSRCGVVFLSSAAVYGNPLRIPICEDDATHPISPYGFHKLACESLLREYHSVYGVRCCAARIFSAYGDGLRRQVLWDICRRLVSERAVELHGTGEETRDFIHASDVARGLAIIAEQAEFAAETYNLAGGREISIRLVAELLSAGMDRSADITFSGRSRPGDPLRWRADVSRIGRLGFHPTMRFEDGAAAYACWAASLNESRWARV